jgi:hypothetical protein
LQLPFWIPRNHRLPICNIPWRGTSVVLSNGNVNFCCFSDSVAGNVYESSFEEIWNGQKMVHIRSELTAGRIPKDCQKLSCPIFRNDNLTHIKEKMYGRFHESNPDGHKQLERMRASLMASSIHFNTTTNEFHVKISAADDGIAGDLYLAFESSEGHPIFMLEYDYYGVPFDRFIGTREKEYVVKLELSRLKKFSSESRIKFVSALFDLNSNCLVKENCLWSKEILV